MTLRSMYQTLLHRCRIELVSIVLIAECLRLSNSSERSLEVPDVATNRPVFSDNSGTAIAPGYSNRKQD
jgi:hypothetical protein